MRGYTKLFSSILGSTVWREANHVRIVWITMLALADRHGVIEASVPGLADLARVPRRHCEQALERLQAPDPDSRSAADEGRRIRPVPGGWQLVNHAFYRAKMDADERREYQRVKAQEYRDARVDTASTNIDACQQSSTPINSRRHSTEAEADPEADPETHTPRARATRQTLTTGGAGTGQNPRDHLRHGCCPWQLHEGTTAPCVPEFLHGQLLQQIGGDADRLRAFYQHVAALTLDPCGDEPIKFWRARFAAAFPAAAPARPATRPAGSARTGAAGADAYDQVMLGTAKGGHQ